MPFKKGQKGGPGRPPIILPEVQSLIDQNRNTVRVKILELLNLSPKQFSEIGNKPQTMMEQMLTLCIERMGVDGDIDKLRSLLEIPLGKLPENRDIFEVSEDEKALVLEYRRRLKEQEQSGLIAISPSKPE